MKPEIKASIETCYRDLFWINFYVSVFVGISYGTKKGLNFELLNVSWNFFLIFKSYPNKKLEVIK